MNCPICSQPLSEPPGAEKTALPFYCQPCRFWLYPDGKTIWLEGNKMTAEYYRRNILPTREPAP